MRGGGNGPPAKVQAVLNWQALKTQKQLQSFLGFANFNCQFIPSFARVVLPLTDLLKTKHLAGKPRPEYPLKWTMECQQAFETLKALFAKDPILRHPNPTKPFVIQANTSDMAGGAIPLQTKEGCRLQPCTYASCKLTDTECRWAIWEEAFVVWQPLLTWRHLFGGGCNSIRGVDRP